MVHGSAELADPGAGLLSPSRVDFCHHAGRSRPGGARHSQALVARSAGCWGGGGEAASVRGLGGEGSASAVHTLTVPRFTEGGTVAFL